MNPEELAATLIYWRACGIELLAGETPFDADQAALRLKATLALTRTAPGGKEDPAPNRPLPHPGMASREPATQRRRLSEAFDQAAQGRGSKQARNPGLATPATPEAGNARGAAAEGRARGAAAEEPTAPPRSDLAAAPAAPAPTAETGPRRAAWPLTPAPSTGAAELQEEATLGEMAATVAACQKCHLCLTRNHTVFGVGSPQAPVVFVGEGPGEEEDLKGEPFVGAAGRLLDRMLFAIGFSREQIYIANVIKCRPPGNRNPHPDEVAACQGYLFHQLERIVPRAIFAMGRFAIMSLLGQSGGVGRARGRTHRWRGIPVIASYHPAYYLRQPWRKREGWRDMRLLMDLLELEQEKKPVD